MTEPATTRIILDGMEGDTLHAEWTGDPAWPLLLTAYEANNGSAAAAWLPPAEVARLREFLAPER